METLDRSALRATADTLVNSGLIHRDESGSASVYAIEPAKHAMASYYRNTIVHHFLDKAIIEFALFKVDDECDGNCEDAFWAEAMRLRDLFKFEFFYPPREQFQRDLRAELDRTDGQWSARLAAGGQELRRLVRSFQPFVGHAVLLPFVEAYTIVLDQFVRLKVGEALESKACVEQGLAEGRQAYLLRRISSEASIGKILFENGYKMVEHLGLAGVTTEEVARSRRKLLAEFRGLSRRMEKMRIELLAQAERNAEREMGT